MIPSGEYSTFTDTKYGFEIKYPKAIGKVQQEPGILWIQIGKEVATGDKDCLFLTQFRLNRDRHSWVSEYQKYLDIFKNKSGDDQITYKTFNPDFFVISGTLLGRIFYHKEIAFRRDGKWFALIFHMAFLQTQKKVWDPVLVECVKTLNPCQTLRGSPITMGWPDAVEAPESNRLLNLAKQWMEDHLQCVQYPKERDDTVKPPMGKCKVDEFNDVFFRLTDHSPLQFVLSASGPSYSHIGDNGYAGCDQKFVLFSFEKGELSEKVIYETTPLDKLGYSSDDAYTSFEDTVDFVDFSDGSKAFL